MLVRDLIALLQKHPEDSPVITLLDGDSIGDLQVSDDCHEGGNYNVYLRVE